MVIDKQLELAATSLGMRSHLAFRREFGELPEPGAVDGWDDRAWSGDLKRLTRGRVILAGAVYDRLHQLWQAAFFRREGVIRTIADPTPATPFVASWVTTDPGDPDDDDPDCDDSGDRDDDLDDRDDLDDDQDDEDDLDDDDHPTDQGDRLAKLVGFYTTDGLSYYLNGRGKAWIVGWPDEPIPIPLADVPAGDADFRSVNGSIDLKEAMVWLNRLGSEM